MTDFSIPGYELIKRIGVGGMAEVYLAKQVRLDREVALKILQPPFVKDPAFCERFIREARIAAKLNHPNIVQIFDVDQYQQHLFLSMEHVDGGDLNSRRSFLQSYNDILHILAELTSALDFAHSQGYIHRDIKPSNILFRKSNSLVISDFGIARAMRADSHLTITGSLIGTPNYMSPEQAQSLDLDGRADLYSAAVIAYQMITGELPYFGESTISIAIKHISAPIPKLENHLQPLQPFFDKALAKAPNERFSNGAEMLEVFSKYLSKINQATFYNYAKKEELITEDACTASQTPTEVVVPDPSLITQIRQPQPVETALTNEPDRVSLSKLKKAYTLLVARFHHLIEAAKAKQDKQSQYKIAAVAFTVLLVSFVGVSYLIWSPSENNLTAGIIDSPSVPNWQNYDTSLQPETFNLPQPEIQPPPKVVTGNTQPATKPTQEVAIRPTLTQAQQYLAQAEENYDAGNIIGNNQNDAYYFYRQVLSIEPRNVKAIAGIDKVKTRLTNQVRLEILNKNIDNARQTLQSLAEIAPESPDITPLKSEIDQTEKHLILAQRQQDKIQELYQRADRYLEEKRADDADKIFARIKRLSPGDPGLPDLGKRIADGYVILAQREIEAKDWRDVNVWVERGLQHVPDHRQLLRQRGLAESKLNGH